MRHLPTLCFTLVASLAAVTVTTTSARAQSDAGPDGGSAGCALEDDWRPGPIMAPSLLVPQWEAEAAAHGAFGSEASFALEGADLHVTGQGLVVAAGQSFSAIVLQQGTGLDYLFLPDATVGAETGTLILQGPRIAVSGATLSAPLAVRTLSTAAAPALVVSAAPALVSGAGLTLDLPDDWADAEAAAQTLSTAALSLSGTTLSGYTRAVLLTTSGEIALSGPIVVESAGAVQTRAASSGGEHALLLEADTFSVAGEKIGLAGDFTAGDLIVDGVALASAPKVVLVRGGPVLVGAGGVFADDVLVTQALDDEGPLLSASLEAKAATAYVQVDENDMVYLHAAVREAGFEHDALFAGIEVEGCVGVETVQVVVDQNLPSFVGLIFDVIAASGWAAPIVALASIALLPGAILVDAFASFLEGLFCIFGCPEPPPPPEPYPAWLEPGEARAIELVVNGDLPPGDYPTRIRLLGKNHAAAELNVLVRVGEGSVPEQWHCPHWRYGSYGSCDCGCGAVDPDCPTDPGAEACEAVWCSGSPTSPGGMAHPDDVSRCWWPPEEWACEADRFAAGDDVCDCGCAALDPDCGEGASAADCSFTWCGGGAQGGVQGGRLVDGDIAECLVPPPGWICGADAYGDGVCNCGCNSMDLDCAAGAGVESCVTHVCATEVDPDDLAVCLPPDPPADPNGDADEADDDEGDDDDGSSLDCASGEVSPRGAPLSLGLVLALGLLLSARRRTHRAAPASYSAGHDA